MPNEIDKRKKMSSERVRLFREGMMKRGRGERGRERRGEERVCL